MDTSGPRFTILAAVAHEQFEMSDPTKNTDPYAAFLAAKEAALEAELAAVRASRATLAQVSHRSPEEAQTAQPPAGGKPTLIERIIDIFKSTGRPQSPGELVTILIRSGVDLESEYPANVISYALRTRAQKHGDVFNVGFGKWDLKAGYSPEKIRELEKVSAGMGGRARVTHIKRTKAGINKRKAAGAKWGRPNAITVEQILKFRAGRERGEKIGAALDEAGIVRGTYYVHREAINAWKPGDPWPLPKDPQEPVRDGESRHRHVRLVK
jgi:hypothetical protein